MTKRSRNIAAQFIGGFGRTGDPVQYISVEPGARKKARQFARRYGGKVYRAVAVGRAVSLTTAKDLGRGYIVANKPPIEFVYWRQYYAKIMEIKDMSRSDRKSYIHALGIDVFEDRRTWKRWLLTRNRALGMKKPAELIRTALGAEVVYNELLQIEYGVLA